MRTTFRAVALVLGLSAAGCSGRTALNEEIRGRVGDVELGRLQVYASDEIQLWRTLRSDEPTVTARHTLRIDRDKKLEEIRFASGTPGVILKVEKNRVQVSFEPPVDGVEVTLTFQVGWNGNKEGYYLYPDKMSETGEMMVNYAGKTYTATAGSRMSHLEIDQDKVKASSHDVHDVPGRRIGDEPPPK
jgi:hypothetical protein